MQALGNPAFHEDVTPWWLWETSQQVDAAGNHELSAEFAEFASTFLDITELPELRQDSGLDNLRRYV